MVLSVGSLYLIVRYKYILGKLGYFYDKDGWEGEIWYWFLINVKDVFFVFFVCIAFFKDGVL